MFGRATIRLGIGPHSSFDFRQHGQTDYHTSAWKMSDIVNINFTTTSV